MKVKNLFTLFAFSSALILNACQKQDAEPDPEIETTFNMSEDQAVSESLNDDANVVFFESAVNANLYRTTQPVQTTNSLSCATVTVTPQNSFPKTIVIDFGAGCTSADGITRKGKINIVLSDYVHNNGSTAVITFDNYYTLGYKVEGTITWTNTSTPNEISWSRQVSNGKVTVPLSGYYWLHEGIKYVTQTAGANTPLNLLDDVYSVTGNHTV
ncbi:MAG: hypothetical protein EPN92_08750, partial [Chitinophagaceae bacterium]